MVEEHGELYRCEACGLCYSDRSVAGECEEFCREHNACNPEITALAVDSET